MTDSKVELVFTVAEKKEFLSRLGYDIKNRTVTKAYSVNGGGTVPMITAVAMARRDGNEWPLHEAFEIELKAKLLLL